MAERSCVTRACNCDIKSEVAITMQTIRSDALAISLAFSTAIGLSIMTMIGRWLPPAASNKDRAVSTSSLLSMFGNNTASTLILATAFMSSGPHCEIKSFTRTTTSRKP